MSTQLSVVDLMRIRHMKGEPLLQQGDSFPLGEMLDAMKVVEDEAKARGLAAPVAFIKNPG